MAATGLQRFDDDDIRLVSLFADQAAIAIENGRLYDASQREVSERRRVEEALRRERDFIANILETAEALVAVLDPQGWIMMFNRKCQQVSGYTEHEVLGRVLWEFLIPAEDVEAVRQALTAAPALRRPTYLENPWLTKDGRRAPVIWSNSVFWDADGNPVYLIVTGLDASERVAHEREIQRRNQELTVLYQVVRAASASLDPVEVFKQVTTTLAEVGQYPIVATHAKVDGQFEQCGAVGLENSAPLAFGRVSIDASCRPGNPSSSPMSVEIRITIASSRRSRPKSAYRSSSMARSWAR